MVLLKKKLTKNFNLERNEDSPYQIRRKIEGLRRETRGGSREDGGSVCAFGLSPGKSAEGHRMRRTSRRASRGSNVQANRPRQLAGKKGKVRRAS